MAFKRSLRAILTICAGAFATLPAYAAYSKLVMFGDSMSDTHRMYKISKALFGKPFPDKPNLPGRVCDGPVAVEFFAEHLGVPMLNYSFAGASSGYDTLALVPLGVLTQINEYLNNNAVVPIISTLPIVSPVLSLLPGTGRADPNALHMIWTGPDDYYRLNIGMNSLTTVSLVANIKQAVATLHNAGARHFFIPLMPDLSLTPSAKSHEKATPGYINAARRVSDEFAVELTKTLAELRQRYPNADFRTFDTLTFMREQFTKVRAEGKIVDVACRNGGLDLTTLRNTPMVVCPNPQDHVFWDSNHPTSWVNVILAQAWSKVYPKAP